MRSVIKQSQNNKITLLESSQLNVSMSALKPLHTFFSTIVGQRTINPADSNIIDYIGVPRHTGVPQKVSIIFFP